MNMMIQDDVVFQLKWDETNQQPAKSSGETIQQTTKSGGETTVYSNRNIKQNNH